MPTVIYKYRNNEIKTSLVLLVLRIKEKNKTKQNNYFVT